METVPAGKAVVRVHFRIDKYGPFKHDPVAWLFDVPAIEHRMVCYVHVGQHSEGDYTGCLARSRPATEKEYAPLLRELKQIYESDGDCTLVVVKRRPRK